MGWWEKFLQNFQILLKSFIHNEKAFGERPFGLTSHAIRSSHVIIQLISNTAKQRYIYSKQTRKSENKDTVIKFLMSRNIRSLRNTTHNNERYVPITGYRRHNCTRTKCINSLGHHRPSPQNDGYDGRQSPQRLSSIHISRQKEMQTRVKT